MPREEQQKSTLIPKKDGSTSRQIPFSPPPTVSRTNLEDEYGEANLSEPKNTEPPTISEIDSPNIVSGINEQRMSEKRTLKKSIQETEKAIESLKGKVESGIKGGFGWSILKTFFPAIANSIENVFSGIKRGKIETTVKTLRTLRTTLENVRTATGVIDAVKSWGALIGSTLETVIVPIILIFMLPAFLVFYLALKIGALTKIINELIEKLDTVLVPLEKELKKQKTIQDLKNKKTQLEVAVKSI